MLGAVNIPCETAIEFYATPDLESRNRAKDVSSTPSILSTQLSCGSEKSMDGYVAISGQKRIFSKRRSSQVDYLKDGRKVLDGTVLEIFDVPQMWEKLLLRTMVHKIEEEISKPAGKQLPTVSESNAEYTNSTLSLVSKGLLDKGSQTCNDRPSSPKPSIKKRAHSYDCPRTRSTTILNKANPM